MNAIFWNGNGGNNTLSRAIGPYKIAHWVRKHNYNCQVIDFIDHMAEESLYEVTKKFITPETVILGLSTTFIALTYHTHSDGVRRNLPEHVMNVIKRIKNEYPKIKIVIGGYQSEKMKGYGIIDATIMTYTEAPEDIFIEYLDYLVKGSEPPHSYECHHDKRPIYDKANNPKYNIEVDDFQFTKQDCVLPNEPLPLDVSRGCIFACRFCQYPHLGKKKFDYIRGMDYLEQEILHNYNEFGTTMYLLMDDTFNDSEHKMKAFYEMTRRLPFKIQYSTYLRADLIHRFPDMTHYLKDSGLFGAFFGLESLHPTASNIVGKAWSGKHAKEYVPDLYHNIWNGEIPIHVNFIVGITGDTIENVNGTVDWFIQNKLHSINFERLSLHGPDDAPVWTVKSEFDKNASKYGYTIMEPNNNSIFANWETDNWTRDIATHYANEANKNTLRYKKINPWSIPSYMWQGTSKETILTRYAKDYPGISDQINGEKAVKSREIIASYINLLIDI